MRAALGFAVVLALVAVVLTVAGRVLVVADPLPPRADAIVILAGSIADRTLEAADLYRAGVAPRVVVTRVRRQPGEFAIAARGAPLPESDELTVAALRRLGVPERAVLVLRRRTYSTKSEVRTIARWACRTGARHLIVVTSRAHTRRARLILHRTLAPKVEVTMRASRYDTFSPTQWFRSRRDAKIVLSEWQKLSHYWLRENWTIKKCGGLTRSPRAAA